MSKEEKDKCYSRKRKGLVIELFAKKERWEEYEVLYMGGGGRRAKTSTREEVR